MVFSSDSKKPAGFLLEFKVFSRLSHNNEDSSIKSLEQSGFFAKEFEVEGFFGGRKKEGFLGGGNSN